MGKEHSKLLILVSFSQVLENPSLILQNGVKAAIPGDYTASLMPQIFGMLKQGKITFRLALKQHWSAKDNQKAALMTTRLMATGLKSKNIV